MHRFSVFCKRKKISPKAGGPNKKKRDMTNSPFMKPKVLSVELQAVVGATTLPRPHVVRELWKYIKANHLQDPNNKRNIKCDAAMKAWTGKSEVSMFEMQKLLTPHLQDA